MHRKITDIMDGMDMGGNQNPSNPLPPPPPGSGPLRRRYSVNGNFQAGHPLWTDGYDEHYLPAGAGEVVEEVIDGASNEHFVQAQKGDRTGYIPRDILTNI